MKARHGFVSNSSSCSFIIDYYDRDEKRKPISKAKLLKVMKKLVEIEQLFNPRIKFEDIFTLNGDANEMCIGDKGEDIIKIRKAWEKEYDKDDPDMTDFKKVKGKLIVSSASDNTIPYWMMQIFETKLNAKHWHWG